MSVPRIYADFNGIQHSVRTPGRSALYLHYFGSLIQLSRLRICLSEGMLVNAYSDSDHNEDLEVTGTVYFDHKAKQWFAEFEDSDIRYVPSQPEQDAATLQCWSCGSNLAEKVKSLGLQLGDKCANCGQEIHAPLKPPHNDAVGV